MRKPKNIILGITASIAIYKACEIVRRLRKEGFSVTVVMTKEAEKLISPLLFQSLSENKVYIDLFERPQDWEIEHVSLAKRADLILIAPATANIIAKLASGICDDLLTCLVLAAKARVLIAPAMHENMYKHKITQENIQKLKSIGYKFIAPIKGRLVSGEIGLGHLAEIDKIIQEVKKII